MIEGDVMNQAAYDFFNDNGFLEPYKQRWIEEKGIEIIEKWKKEGFEIGKKEGMKIILEKMIARNYSVEEISTFTGFTINEIKGIIENT
ncbi:MAG: hypothetical protein LBT07_02165 [Endomicrobium sp.]|jgi:hypothetical protein|nr:hypothetical protein [Endomicrobium sp.]